MKCGGWPLRSGMEPSRPRCSYANWNTVYLTEAVATVRKRGEEIPEATLAHIAPLGWEHISLTGNYHFAQQAGRDLSHLHPLRMREEDKNA